MITPKKALQLITFRGAIIHGDQRDYYHYDFDLCVHCRKACGGFSLDLIEGTNTYEGHNDLEKYNESMTWGYDSRSTDLLSVSMLANSLDPDWLLNHEHCGQHQDRDLILKLYRKFTKEIASHLLGKWTMTSEEVIEWIKKHQKNSAAE